MAGPVLSRRDFLKTTLKTTFGSLGFGLGVYGYGHEIEPRWLDVERVSLTLPRLTPAFDGYRIVHISDLHRDYWMSASQSGRIMRKVNQQAPDLIVNTGDFVSAPSLVNDQLIEVMIDELAQLRAHDGVISVLGNHDHWVDAARVRDMLHRSGSIELENQFHTLRRGDEVLHIAGLGDILEGFARLDLVVERLPADDSPAIVLVHEPYEFESTAATGRFDLQLSGHIHGGQVSIPLIGRPWKQYNRGVYRSGATTMYLTRGLGMMMPFMRIASRPEITVLTLRTP